MLYTPGYRHYRHYRRIVRVLADFSLYINGYSYAHGSR